MWQKVMAHRPASIKLEGQVILGFRLDPGGRLTEAHIVQSSNIAMLDRQAMRALREASPFPPLPEGTGPSGHDFTVPINFHP
ncbi:TonB family protein [Novosphingobium sp. FSY-8]|uniref:TonB family protein n=1 Tax=Novosphingobium ovatum TaxID=1908523 RepID=A0ABW9XF51_9SPHN|nr:TonB family protein [Novosphingobium ovatum]